MRSHMYGTCELPANNTTLGKASPDLAVCFVAGINPNALERYLRDQSFSASRRDFALNLLADFGQASALLCIRLLLGNLWERC